MQTKREILKKKITFNLYEGSDTYKVNATSFPDEDGDRLFIIIPKQAACDFSYQNPTRIHFGKI